MTDERKTPIRVHAPTLDEQMRPDFRLINMECPFGFDGHCGACDCFQGVMMGDDGMIASYMVFDGVCAGTKKETA
jgi:hypothetical protein